jgi:SAM-dependent methyltransferase
VKLTEKLHQRYGHPRRVRILAEHLSGLISQDALVLDVGCGDGLLDQALIDRRHDIRIHGIDVAVRPSAQIPVEVFDGSHIPKPDASFDFVLFADVLHHSNAPLELIREAARVGRRGILIKDHTLEGFLAGPTLRFMDDVGNARHGVALPYTYWTHARWKQTIDELGLEVESWISSLGLYPKPADWIFGRSLHFIAHLAKVPE